MMRGTSLLTLFVLQWCSSLADASQLLTLLPFENPSSVAHLASAALALDHCTTRNPVIVKELSTMCNSNSSNIEDLFLKAIDTSLNAPTALARFVDTDLTGTLGIVGPPIPDMVTATAAWAEFWNVPQILFSEYNVPPGTGSSSLATERNLVGDVDVLAKALISKFKHRGYMQLLFDSGNEALKNILRTTRKFKETRVNVLPDNLLPPVTEQEGAKIPQGSNRRLQSMSGSGSGSGDGTGREDSYSILEDAAEEVEEDGMHTIFVLADNFEVLQQLAELAIEYNVVGPDWFWILNGDLFPGLTHLDPEPLELEEGSALERLLRGAAIYTHHDPFIYEPKGDPFLDTWRAQDSNQVEKMNAIHPQRGMPDFTPAESDFFQSNDPVPYSSFVYDAIITHCLRTCSKEDFLKRGEFSFDGASGEVEMVDGKVSSDDSRFGIYNLRSDRGRIEAVLSSLYESGEWTEVAEFLYYDGTPDEPEVLVTVIEPNFLSNSVQMAGFMLVALSYVISFSSLVWVIWKRNTGILKASQPFFLGLLCIGSSVLMSSVMFVSFDESDGWSQTKLNRGCAAVPWFFTIGYMVMYCAMYCKLWRIKKIFSIRRRTVTVTRAMIPFLVLVTLCLVVLIVWQLVDPLSWVRRFLDPDSAGREITYGDCQTVDTNLAAWVVPLLALLATITIMTMVVAWKTREIQSEYSESMWVFFAVFAHLQSWLVGLPLIFVLDDVSKDAAYLTRVFFVFVLATSTPIMVIWPKIYRVLQEKYFPTRRLNTSRSSTPSVRLPNDSSSVRITGVSEPFSGSSSHSLRRGIRGSNHSATDPTSLQTKIDDLEMQNLALREELKALKSGDKNTEDDSVATSNTVDRKGVPVESEETDNKRQLESLHEEEDND